jgi:hypothetical protein
MRPQPDRAARYRAMFGSTHAFLPERNGIVPNTLHCLLHAATVAMLLALTVDCPSKISLLPLTLLVALFPSILKITERTKTQS